MRLIVAVSLYISNETVKTTNPQGGAPVPLGIQWGVAALTLLSATTTALQQTPYGNNDKAQKCHTTASAYQDLVYRIEAALATRLRYENTP